VARLEISNEADGRRVTVTLSRRNLLALLHKLDLPGSARTLENTDCYEDGAQTPWFPGEDEHSALPRTLLVLRCEDDTEHYGSRPVGPGIMHPATERFVDEHGGAAGEVLLQTRPDGAQPRVRDADGDWRV